MPRVCLMALLLVPLPAFACKCELTLSACNETANSRLVFVGTVDSIEPRFLDAWNPALRSAVSALNSEFQSAQQQPAGAPLEKLKQSYLKTFPDLPEEGKQKIRDAKAPGDFAGLFTWILEHGRTVRFTVRTLYRNAEEDDKDDDGSDAAPAALNIWTPFGDCGFNFQVGETYLVYATGDEESPVLSTSVCSRTRRLTDSGEDLAYLFYYRNQPDRSTRLDGFVTTNELYQREYDAKQFTGSIAQPVSGVTVELRSENGARYAATDPGGRFTFDGLAAGEYSTVAYAAGLPREPPRDRRSPENHRGCEKLRRPGAAGAPLRNARRAEIAPPAWPQPAGRRTEPARSSSPNPVFSRSGAPCARCAVPGRGPG